MPSTNFDLAPPSVTVDGLAATPIEIQHIIARLAFDGASSSATGDATLEFVVGPDGGCPIFDLRQTVTAAWLDGNPLTPAQVAHHDFGGGAGAELQVVDTARAAGSAHTLRLTYGLGPPHASTVGGYLPALTWSAGSSPAAQLRLHRPRTRPLPGGVGAGQPDLRPVQPGAGPGDPQHHHPARPDHQRRRRAARGKPLVGAFPSSSTAPSHCSSCARPTPSRPRRTPPCSPYPVRP